MSTRDAVRTFVAETQRWDGDAADLADDHPLLEDGVLDSLGINNLVAYIEDDLGFEVELEDLVPENFETIDAIMAMLDKGST